MGGAGSLPVAGGLLCLLGFALDAFGDPEAELGFVVDGVAGGDGFGLDDLVGREADGDEGLAVPGSDHATLLGREFEGTDGQQLVPELAGVVGVKPVGGLFFAGEVWQF